MAMLADRKEKQKFTLNPRGKYWTDDASKFGQKMLEKMGWSSGKGLGAKEDGITEHIKQSYKNDSRGIGFKDKDSQWTQHEDNFSSLLQNLAENDHDTIIKMPKISLEKKSQSSRARVHYHKFTRGKDLSRCSEKDLANVFGRKTLEPQRDEIKIEETLTASNDDYKFGVPTVTSGNMTDYFKSKLKKTFSNCPVNRQTEEEHVGIGVGSLTPTTLEIAQVKESTEAKQDDYQQIKKKRRKSKKDEMHCCDNLGFNDVTKQDLQFEEPTQATNKTRKTAKENLAFDNPSLNLTDGPKDVNIETVSKVPAESKKKSKKLSKEALAFDNPSSDLADNSNGVSVEDVPQVPTRSKQKSKKSTKECLAFDNPSLDLADSPREMCIQQGPEASYDNPAFNDGNVADQSQGIRRNKKRKLLETIVEETNNDLRDIVIAKKKIKHDDNNDNVTVGTISKPLNRRKQKNQQDVSNGIDNPACTAGSAEQNIEETIASMSNAIDDYQNELENQLNETKAKKNVRKKANKKKTPRKAPKKFVDPEAFTNPRKSIKDVVKGGLRVKFSGSNLNKIPGYGIHR